MDLKSPPAPHAPRAASSNPAMDVVSPPATEPSASLAHEVDPLDQLAADDKAEQQAHAHHEAPKPVKSAKTAKPKQSQSGVGMAITATVIIVLGLAALATYAYLQTVR